MIFKNARIVDVVKKRVYRGWFSVEDGKFVYVEEGDPHHWDVDLRGVHVVPCLIDSHMHVESSFLTPAQFARAALRSGTCAVLHDPHEMANVFGKEGVKIMERASKRTPMKFLMAVPSCVPASRADLETPNASLNHEDIAELLRLESAVALGEVMDYRELIEGNEELVEIVKTSERMGFPIEGHCPDLLNEELSRYISFGIRSDHTLMNPEKISQELSKGMYVMIQRKSLTRENIEYLMSLPDRSRILLVTDDVPASDLVNHHLNGVVSKAVEMGWDPVDAIASATLRPAVYLGLDDLGCICPGKRASFFTTEDLKALEPMDVYIDGEKHEDFEHEFDWSEFIGADVPEIKLEDLRFGFQDGERIVNVVVSNEFNTHTKLEKMKIRFEKGFPVLPDDVLMVGVFRRRGGGSVGLLRGMKMENCAFASTFSHDTHNITLVGRDPNLMVRAAETLKDIGGGIVLATPDEVEYLELEIGGIITDSPVEEVARDLEKIENSLKNCGFNHSNPMVFLTVLSLTVSPEYKFSDLGIVDVLNRKIVSVS